MAKCIVNSNNNKNTAINCLKYFVYFCVSTYSVQLAANKPENKKRQNLLDNPLSPQTINRKKF